MNKKNKILISSSAKKTIRESVLLAQELQTGIEISRLPIYKNENLNVEDAVEILKNDLNGFNDRITVHAMFSDVNISSRDLTLRKISRKRFEQSFEVAKALGADTVLYHTGYKGTKHHQSISDFKKNFINYWKDFVQEFEKNNMIAVLENVFETTPKFCYELFEGINSSNLKLALDTGHVNLYAHNTNISEWIDLYGNNLYHLHIHNNFRENDDHSNFENGTLNFKEILLQLKNEVPNASYVFEMFKEDDIRKSLNIFKQIIN